MELQELDTVQSHTEGAEMRVLNPINGKETDLYITLRGKDWPKFKTLSRKKNIDIAKAIKEEKEFDEEDMDCKLLAACAVDWRGLTNNGNEVPFSEEACYNLFKSSPGIKEQADFFIGSRKNFTKP